MLFLTSWKLAHSLPGSSTPKRNASELSARGPFRSIGRSVGPPRTERGPIPRRPDDLIYAVGDRPPPGPLIALGLQHAALASVYLVLIVIVAHAAGATDQTALSMVSFALVALAISSALQASPVGSGYLAIPVYSAIYLAPSVLAAHTGGLPLVFGMTIFAGLVQASLSFGLRNLRWLFPPAVSGLIVTVVGIDLGLVGMSHVLAIPEFTRHEDIPAAQIAAAVATLAAAIGISIWGKGIVRLLASLIGLILGTTIAIAGDLIEPAQAALVSASPWLGVPDATHLGLAFDLDLVPAYLAAAVAATLRTIGVITTCEKINDADWKRPSIGPIQRGNLADGIGCALAGLMGAIGLNTAPSLVGVSNSARATSRHIAYSAAVILLAFALVPKLGTLFLALPLSVAGAMLVFTGSMMIAGGVGIMLSRDLDSRATFTIGVSLLLGMSHQVFPDYFAHLPAALQTVTGGSLSLCVLSALVLTMLFRIGTRRTATAIGGGTQSVEAFLESIPAQCAAWKVPPDVAQTCHATVKEAFAQLRASGDVDRFEGCTLHFDAVDLIVELIYEGPLIRIAESRISRRNPDEEQAFASGIAVFLTGIYPDRLETRTSAQHAVVRLIFST